jgi:Domain of unknown function (DUF4124)
MPLTPHTSRQRIAVLRPHAPAAFAASALVVAGLWLLSTNAHATTYKWVDDQGVVHYTDKLPPEAINKGSVELNKQGVPIKKTEPALTPEQRRAKEAEEERARAAAKIRDEIERKDRALLQTYTTESEIDLARSRALGTISAQVQSAQAYSANLNKRRTELNTRLAALGDKPVPPQLERERTNVDEELAKQSDLILAKQREIAIINARYDADKLRWQQLRVVAEAQSAGNAPPAPGGTMATSGTGTPAPAPSVKK